MCAGEEVVQSLGVEGRGGRAGGDGDGQEHNPYYQVRCAMPSPSSTINESILVIRKGAKPRTTRQGAVLWDPGPGRSRDVLQR